MIIDRQKPYALVSVLLAAAFGISTGCSSPVSPERDKVKTTPNVPTRLVPEVCSTLAEFLRPLSLSADSVTTYPGVVVVNQAGSAIDLAVRPPVLTRLNNEVSLDLAFTPDTTNITYFFAGSFKQPEARKLISDFIERDKFYLTFRYCQEQYISSGRIRYSVISVADELAEVIRRNPRRYLPEDPFWKTALEVQFALSYAARTKGQVSDIDRIPIDTPSLSADERRIIVGLGLPFSITRLNPDYVRLFQDDTITS